MRATLIWAMLAAALALPVILAAFSPYLAYRSGVYVAAGFAGILAMSLLVLQPLLAGRALPALSARVARRAHRVTGAILVGLILAHVGALWLTSPPDVIDALTLSSPTPFSIWGVLAMWAVFASATLAALRKSLRPRHWRRAHLSLALVIVGGTILHALLIDGTMETLSKWALSVLLALAVLRSVRMQSARR